MSYKWSRDNVEKSRDFRVMGINAQKTAARQDQFRDLAIEYFGNFRREFPSEDQAALAANSTATQHALAEWSKQCNSALLFSTHGVPSVAEFLKEHPRSRGFILVISHYTKGKAGGHAMAYALTKNGPRFFDPNAGTYAFWVRQAKTVGAYIDYHYASRFGILADRRIYAIRSAVDEIRA